MMVANQCIYDGGPAVVAAQNLVHTQYPFYKFDTDVLCGQSVLRQVNTGSLAQQNLTVKVYPNPASDYLIIQSAFTKGSVLEIIDLTGRVVLRNIINTDSNFNKINTSSLSKGLYHFKITGNNNPNATGSFEINK